MHGNADDSRQTRCQKATALARESGKPNEDDFGKRQFTGDDFDPVPNILGLNKGSFDEIFDGFVNTATRRRLDPGRNVNRPTHCQRLPPPSRTIADRCGRTLKSLKRPVLNDIANDRGTLNSIGFKQSGTTTVKFERGFVEI